MALNVQSTLHSSQFLCKSLTLPLTLLMFGCTAEADVQAGKAAAASCQACHGVNGIAVNPQTPNLAGQQPLYLSNQLLAFRNGSRTNSIMSPLARSLSDEDIANLAAYFASLPASGTR